MLVIAGLGNPGRQYSGHRHNVGFMAADAIFRRHSFSPWTRKFNAEVAEGRLAGEKVLLVKPQTYMNRSGQAIGEVLRYFKLQPSDLVVFYDELDLAPGKVRVKTGGGDGGHNGIRSIDAHCGKNYRRVRIGIGHPGDKALVNPHVLGDFAKADRAWLDLLLDAIADAAPLLVKGDDSGFMNKVSLAVPRAQKERKAAAAARQPAEGKERRTTPPDRPGEEEAKPETETGQMAHLLRKLFGKGR